MPALRLADVRRAAGLDAVARECAQRLGAIVARPPRDEDDWSIAWAVRRGVAAPPDPGPTRS
jgi:hypothetical protein